MCTEGCLVKRLVTMVVALLVAVPGGDPAWAHVDTLGAPDPYWQRLANGGRTVADGTTAVAGAVHPGFLAAYMCVVAAVLLLLAVIGIRRMLPDLLASSADAITGADTIRTIEVLPPSARREAQVVLAVAAAIVVGAVLVIAPGHGGVRDGARAGDLLPFQVLFRDAPAPVERMYRELQEGLLEAERRRAATGRWPAVEVLAADGIPPFAPARPPYRWRLAQDGPVVNYLGHPEPDGPAFLALVQEPDSGVVDPGAGAALDEFHHRLSDGTLLHVSIWFRAPAAGVPDDRPLAQPAATGWTQVVVGG
jgi:hypothetical protein